MAAVESGPTHKFEQSGEISIDMSCLFQLSSYSVSVLSKAARFIATSSFYGCSIPSRERTFNYSGVGTINLESVFARFHIHCYSSKSTRSRRSAQPKMEEQKDPFFVVRKGDIVGVYKTLSECQAQVGMSVLDPPVSVYKGYSLPKDTEEYLVSHGLQNALYTIKASDLKVDLFGELVPCALQEPMPSKGETSSRDLLHKRPHEVLGSEILEPVGSTSIPIDAMGKHTKLDLTSTDTHSCILEFDGASRGNPGQAGAGAVLRSNDGSLICKLRQGLGIATNNAAEYRAVILGLKYALEKGYTSIRVRGDSKLVCMQLQGLWKVRHQNMCDLYAEAKKLKDKFFFFQIGHVLREFNSDADAQANLAVSLAGESCLILPNSCVFLLSRAYAFLLLLQMVKFRRIYCIIKIVFCWICVKPIVINRPAEKSCASLNWQQQWQLRSWHLKLQQRDVPVRKACMVMASIVRLSSFLSSQQVTTFIDVY